jgi:hypothetical protein
VAEPSVAVLVPVAITPNPVGDTSPAPDAVDTVEIELAGQYVSVLAMPMPMQRTNRQTADDSNGFRSRFSAPGHSQRYCDFLSDRDAAVTG